MAAGERRKILVCRQTFDEVIEALAERFDVEHNQATDAPWSADELRRRLADKDGVLTSGADRVDAAAVADAPRLKAVCNVAVGYNNLDVAALAERGILATNTPGVLDDTTADTAFALMLAAARRLPESERWLRAGHWKGWKNDQFLGVDVHHATLGIVGMGRIGQAIAQRARGFGMKILYYNRRRCPAAVEKATGARYATLEKLLRTSDFVSLNLPYSPEAHHLIGAEQLALMKPTAVLVNAARGGVVDDAALIRALKDKRIFAAGIDVFEGEPKFNPGFLELDNVALVPHIGSATRATRMKMNLLAVKNLVAALSGKRPPNLVNPDAWPKRRR
ncbi:MAG TPA: D-glycerate dehydrogenase [Burkholderiales bacterium]|nr:D-glycerate dehydrogenase [Burkholderiales bacterium]